MDGLLVVIEDDEWRSYTAGAIWLRHWQVDETELRKGFDLMLVLHERRLHSEMSRYIFRRVP